jgi:hypothetical protein
MASLDATMSFLCDTRNRQFWERLFPTPLAAKAADYVINLLGDGCADKHCIRSNFASYATSLSASTDSPLAEISEIEEAIENAITTLLAYNLIEEWEDEDEENVVTTYYNLPAESDD